MRKTQRIDLLTTIRRTIVSFIAITVFIVLGVALFLGIGWVARAEHAMFDSDFEAGHAHHFTISFPYGLTEDDLEELKGTKGIDEVEAGYLSYQEMAVGAHKLVVCLESLPASIDSFLQVEGTFPEKPDEIAIEARQAKAEGIALGDVITFLPDTAEDDEKELDGAGRADKKGDKDGDKKSEGDDGMRYLRGARYTVTALVVSPAYLSTAKVSYGIAALGPGTVDVPAWVCADAFDEEAFFEGKPYVLVRTKTLEGLSAFSEEYEQASLVIEERLEELGDDLGDRRFQHIYDQSKEQVEEGEALVEERSEELEQGRKDLEEGRKDLEEGERDLAEGRSTLAQKVREAEAGLASARSRLDAARGLWNAAVAELEDARTQLAEGERLLEAAEEAYASVAGALAGLGTGTVAKSDAQGRELTQEEIDEIARRTYAQGVALLGSYGVPVPSTITEQTVAEAIANGNAYLVELRDKPFTVAGETVTLNTAPEKLQELRERIAEAQAEVDRKKAELDEGERAYASSLATYEREKSSAEQRIAEGEQRLSKGEEDIRKGEEQLKEGERALADARESVEQGREALSELRDYSWVIESRGENGAVLFLETLANMTENLRWSMASLFLVVGLLVCYSAISRLVYTQIAQIGMKKAAGFTEREINAFFLTYCALCVVLGWVLGVITAIVLVEPVILSAFDSRFVSSAFAYVSLPESLLVFLFEFALLMGSTWLAVSGILRMQAVQMLSGGPRSGSGERPYERLRIWRRLSLLAQTTINNTVSDRRRVVGTLVGVCGCAALIVCAITLDDNVMSSFRRQYEAVYHYDTTVTLKGGDDAVGKDVEILDGKDMRATPVFVKTFILEQSDGQRSFATLTVPMADDFDDFVSLHTLEGSGEDDEPGVWVSAAYHEHLGARVGDEVVLFDSLGRKYLMPIKGFFEHHLPNYQMVLDRDAYEQVFQESPTTNRLLVNTCGKGADAVEELLRDTDGYVQTMDAYAAAKVNYDDFSAVARIVVAIYLALAVVMAACVLLNLNVMHVEERRHELTVLMICGYSLREAKGYVWHDSVVLTVLGIIAGICLGNTVGDLCVRSIEQANTLFLHGISWLAVGIGVAGTLFLSACSLMVALRRIDHFGLADISDM